MRIEDIKDKDFFGAEVEDLLSRLSFSAARPFLVDEATEDDWTMYPRDAESIKAEMLDYMPFAWDKANHCRGLSAHRSIDHMAGWLWLLGYDAAVEQISTYDRYGKPQLRAICEEFGWDWRQWDDGRWANDEMEEGDPPPKTVDALRKD